MKLKIQFGTKELEFYVEYRNRKTISISVEPPSSITVVVPLNTPENQIKEIVKSKGAWIVQKLYSFKNMEHRKIEREFVNGESFMYLGRNYSLQIHVDSSQQVSSVKLFRGKFHVTVNEKNDSLIREAMELWYREKTEEQGRKRIKYYQSFFKKKPVDIKIKEQKKRWGSCTANDELLFNWRCSMAKANALDYIIVHEMCHMYHKNHSQEYWDLLASIMPDYEVRKNWLKNYGVRLDL
ncbi:SprT family zinc-dependent metalloprotease [Clostridium sp.]|uniref:M48 family metallopeptidase n=1 Tax=Clostridium sp. TaxID=1506 RepID=UPI003217B154